MCACPMSPLKDLPVPAQRCLPQLGRTGWNAPLLHTAGEEGDDGCPGPWV